MKKEFTTFELTDIFGISRDRLQQWIGRGFINPSIHRAAGQGDRNLFSREDVYRIALFEKLNKLGFRRIPAAEFAQEEIDSWFDKLPSIAVGNPTIQVVIDLERIQDEVDKKIG